MSFRALLVVLSHRGRILNLLNSPLISIGICLIYAVSLLIIGVLSVEKERRLWMVLPGLCIPIMVAPLLFVTPIGPRCFYGSYLMMMLYACRLFNEILIKPSQKEHVVSKSLLKNSLVAFCLACFAVFFSIFLPIHKLDNARNQYAQAQVKDGETTIIFTAFPDTTFLWCAEPQTDPWITRYKLFYQLPDEISFQYVDLDSFYANYTEYKQRSVSH